MGAASWHDRRQKICHAKALGARTLELYRYTRNGVSHHGPRRSLPHALMVYKCRPLWTTRTRPTDNLRSELGGSMRVWFSLVLMIFVLCVGGEALAQSRVALVIGVSDYKVGGKLPQTLADAEKIRASLAGAGFSVEKLVKPALSKSELESALLAFGERAARADVALLYFAGHGMQHGDDNWLIPASANLRSEAAIRFEGVALQDIMELMKQARFRIIVLDACRNNPFKVNWPQTMSGPDGLGTVAVNAMPVGSMIAFSAAPGQKVPNDGVYADALSRMIREGQGLELNQLMRRVRSEVQRRNPAAAPEYIPNYEGAFSFSAGYDPDAAATAAAGGSELTSLLLAGLEIERRQNYIEARRLYQKACDGGSAMGCFYLGRFYERGLGVRQDYAEARQLYRKACDGGSAMGCNNLGYLYQNGRGVTQDYGQARALYQKGCDGGEAGSCSNLGGLYDNGQGVTQDYGQARRLYQMACDSGSAMGCSNLGVLYENGQGVTQDYGQARALYQKGCDGGEAGSCSNLGTLYHNGQGMTQDYGQAHRLYQKACDSGSLMGCTNLGALYQNGRGVTQDYGQARALYQKGCDGGETASCSNLGLLYDNGQGVTQDYGRARAFYKKACDGGNAVGCTNLGALYRNGLGVAQDYEQARALYQKGCNGGNALGCSYQGDLVHHGLGGSQNRALGLSLLQQGCRMGNQWGCNRIKGLEAQ